MGVAFANAKATHIFFSKHISIYAIFNDQIFNDTLTNDIVSFEQLHPDAQADLGLCCPHMPNDTFSHGAFQSMQRRS